MPNTPPIIAITDDDQDDRLLLAAAFAEAAPGCQILIFDGASALLAHLRTAAHNENGGLPALLLLDLNMPGIDGHQTLIQIRAEPGLKHLPVVILSTSRSPSDCLKSYQQGANAFVSKPSGYLDLVATARRLVQFWTEVARLPAV
ncbi:MAG: response regulator [Lysobacterales bacterium]